MGTLNLNAFIILQIALFVLAVVTFVVSLYEKLKYFSVVSVVSFIAYFYLAIKVNNVESLWIFVSLLGLALLLLEVMVPGTQLFGLLGVVTLSLGVGNSAGTFEIGVFTVLLSVACVIAVVLLMSKWGVHINSLNKLVLCEENSSDKGFVSNMKPGLTGKTGFTTSVLRPSGFGTVDGEKIDMYAENGYIESGVEVEVVREEAMKIVVRRK